MPFIRPQEPILEPAFTSAERAALRRMLEQFEHLKTACPTARRETSDK